MHQAQGALFKLSIQHPQLMATTLVKLTFKPMNGSNNTVYANMANLNGYITNTTEDGRMLLNTIVNGSLVRFADASIMTNTV